MIIADLRALALTEHRGGFNYAQPQPYGKKGNASSYETVPPFGLLGRPRGATNDSAATGLVLMAGDEGFVIPLSDPRWQASLPDTGDGGAGIYATVKIDGNVQTPYVAFFGAGGDHAEGLLRAEVPTAAGITTIEVDPTTGDVTIQHAAGGAAVVVKAASVELGAATGGTPLALATPLVSWITGVLMPALASAPGGPITVAPPSGVACTKVNGT